MAGDGRLVQTGGEPGQAHQRRAADMLGASWHELDTGHYPMLTAVDELSRLIASD